MNKIKSVHITFLHYYFFHSMNIKFLMNFSLFNDITSRHEVYFELLLKITCTRKFLYFKQTFLTISNFFFF